MAIAPGYTNEELREFLYEYELQPWGTKKDWLHARGVSLFQLQRWRSAFFDGDLDRGLIPREGRTRTSRSQRRRIAKQDARHTSENERLRARIHELEQTNGSAEGLIDSCPPVL